MAMEGIRLDDGGSRRNWPLMVPRALLEAYQPLLGPIATMLWVNLYSLVDAEGGVSGQGAGNGRTGSPALLDELARRMAVSAAEVQRAWAVLEGAGLVRRAPGGWVLAWPEVPRLDHHELAAGGGPAYAAAAPAIPADGGLDTPPPLEPASGEQDWDGVTSPAAAVDEPVEGKGAADPLLAVHAAPAMHTPAGVGAGGAGVPAGVGPSSLAGGPARAAGTGPGAAAGSARGDAQPSGADRKDSMDAALGAVVAFYHQRIGLLGPSQFERLRFWVEEQGMSPEVVALAIEETVQSARTPRLNYLEGILRNWYNEGIRCLEDLQRTQRARAIRPAAPVEGAPNAGAYRLVDAEAVRRWKEMFADEYDG